MGWDVSGDPERLAVAQRARGIRGAVQTSTIRMLDPGRRGCNEAS